MSLNLRRGVNLQKTRERYLKKKEKRRGVFWRPKEKETRVRILPPQEEGKDFYCETGYHKLGDDYLQCARFNGDICPICEKVRVLYKGSPSEIELARTIKLKKQYLFNVIVRGSEYIKDSGGQTTDEIDIKIMQVGVQVYDKIINAVLDDDIGDITNVDEGYDVVIKKETKPGQLWPNYNNTYIARKASKLFEDEKDIEYALTHIKDLEQYIKYEDKDDLQEALNNFLKTGIAKIDKSEKKADNNSDEKIDSEDDIPEDNSSQEKTQEKEEEEEEEEKEKEEEKTEEKAEEKEKSDESIEDDFEKWEKSFDDDIE